MGLRVERNGDVAVLVPEGMLKGGKETDELETALRKLIYDEQKKILLDLGRVTHMSSIAIGVLASAHSSAKKRNIDFAVCSIEERINSVLVLVKLANILTVYETRDDALAAMKG